MLGSGALDERPPLFPIVNDEFVSGISICSVVIVGVVGVIAVGDETVPLVVVAGLINK